MAVKRLKVGEAKTSSYGVRSSWSSEAMPLAYWRRRLAAHSEKAMYSASERPPVVMAPLISAFSRAMISRPLPMACIAPACT